MAVRDTLNKIEELAASSMHMPLTGKIFVDEDELTQLVEEFRKELPQELGHAEEIINERETILRAAQSEADKIIKEAQKRAAQLVEENDVVTKSREKARVIEIQAHQKSNEIIANARAQSRQYQEGVQTYANQVFSHLIANVANMANSVDSIEKILKKDMQVLQEAKTVLKQQTYNQAPAQSQDYSQEQNYQQNPQD